jgi:alpha-mannosidase
MVNPLKKRLLGSLILLLLLFAHSLCAIRTAAQENILWQIGKFDVSSAEFRSQGIDYANPKSDAVYRVGQSSDAEDWPRFQPGPANGLAGGRLHPFTILFDLPEKPAGVYRLTIAILYETPRLSHLRVDINGHSGPFYFQPKLNYAAGDWEGTFVPQTSVDTKVIELPAEWFQKGENRLVLTALDAPDTVENSLGSIALGHTGVIYDALKLTQSPAERYAANRITASVEPTIFYRSEKSGLAEIVEARVSFSTMPRNGEASLSIGGKPIVQTFEASGDFGELPIEFPVPEWQGTLPSTFQIKFGSSQKSFPVKLAPQKKWTVFVVPHEHLDIGFTDYPDKVAELHSQAVDGVLDLLPTHPEFRWTLDGSWVAEQYLKGRSPQKQDQFLQSIRDGKITLPMQYANQHTGVASLEGLIRSLYPSAALAREHSLPLGAAHITDVPSYSWSYASILHDAGVKYFAAASNSWRAPVVLQGRWNEKSPFYWEGPDGGRVLMWYSRAYLQLSTMFATPQRLDAVKDALPVFLQAYSGAGYIANAAIIFGSQLENTALNKDQADLVRNWQARYAWPRLQFANFAEAMSNIEQQFHGKLPVFRGDFGSYWEDGFASDSFHTAMHRQNQQRILTAEKFGSIPAVLDPSLRPDESILALAWKNTLLFDEHTWTYVGATTQPDNQQTIGQLALKRAETTNTSEAITRSIHRSWAQFESFLGPKDASLAVFNSLNWRRSGFVEMDLPDGQGLFDTVTHREVPSETLFVGRSTPLPGFGGGYRRVRFLASDIPATGYKLFALRPANESRSTSDKSERATQSDTTIENSYYRVTMDPASGAIGSIWDKQLNRELVDTKSPYRFGAYVYVTGADDMPNNSLYRFGAVLHPPSLTPTAASKCRIVSVQRAPYGTVITLESSAPHTPSIQTQITLLDSVKRIEFRYDIKKESVLSKEAVYIAFPFAVENPRFTYESQTGWIDPAKDELPGGSREWHAVNHWAAVSGDGVSAAIIPRDAPLVNFGDIVRGNWPREFRPKTSTIFSWLMSNYWGTNFAPAQGGDFTFRFDLVSAEKLDPAQLTRTGWEAMTPLESDVVSAAFTSGPLPATEGSLLQVDNPNVAVVTWKRAENAQGSILRLTELAGHEQRVRVSSPFFKVESARDSSILEEQGAVLEVAEGQLEFTLRPFEIKTIFFTTKSSLVSPSSGALPARSGP